MSVMEGELEILLGELHIKMKGNAHAHTHTGSQVNEDSSSFKCFMGFPLAGLIGFARLCPGDQYEVNVSKRFLTKF